MRGVILFLLLFSFMLSADNLALPKVPIVAEGGLIELVRPFMRTLSEELPEHQPVLSASADMIDTKPMLAISTNVIPGAKATPFALKGTIVAVNKKNPLKDISSKDVLRLMRNQYSHWEGTGVPVRNIFLVRGALKSKSGAVKGKTHFVEVRSAQIAAELVKKDVTAVALMPISFAAEPDTELKLLHVDGVAPDFEPVMDGRYNLAKKFYLSVDSSAPAAVKNLAETVLSPAFRRKLLADGFVPLK